jgi:predicted PurR-regulated permease PerM
MSRAERRITLWLKILVLIAVAIYLGVGLLQFLAAVKATALLFVVALFFAYLVYPMVRRFNERLPLGWSILLVYIAIVIVGAAIAQLLVPPLVQDAQNAVKATPGIVKNLGQIFEDPNNRFVQWLSPDERVYLATIPQQVVGFFQTNALDTAQKTVTVLLSTVSVLATVVVVPVLAAYMLLDAEEIKRSFLGLLPAKQVAKAEAIIADLDRVVGGFIRGQIIDGTILATMLTIMLSIAHVPYALLIGVIHQIDGNFVAPRVLKDNVGLSPFWIVISILGFSELFGLTGTFLAVPVAAMIRVLREHLLPAPVSVAEAAPATTDAPRATTQPPKVRATMGRRRSRG